MKKYQSSLSENFQFLEVTFSIYLTRYVFVMERTYTYTSSSKCSVFIKVGTDRRHTSCVVNAKPDS